MEEQLIKTPCYVEETKEYGGDVVNMSGGMENGFWYDRFAIADSDGYRFITGMTNKSWAEHIAKALNSHTALLAVAEAAARYLHRDKIMMGSAPETQTAQQDTAKKLSAALEAFEALRER